MAKVLIFDGTNLLMRAVHASRGREMHADGVFTGGVVIFIKSLARHVKEQRPDRVVVCWDGGRSRFRTELFPAYKSNRRDAPDDLAESRRDTKGLACEFLSLCRIHHVERPGVEADDLVAAYWSRHRRAHCDQVVIVSSDKDFLQLLDNGTRQVRLSSAGTPTDLWTAHRMQEEYGCWPEQWPQVLALSGDSSDGIPGVRGYGVKTAIKKLRAADWSWAAIQDERVVTVSDQVRVNLKLVDLRNTPPSPHPVPPFEPTKPGDATWGALEDYLHRYRLETVRQALYQRALWDAPNVMEAAKIHPGVH